MAPTKTLDDSIQDFVILGRVTLAGIQCHILLRRR
jgi:hypothetical protein